jgi:thiol-disulfide isomerase/thioredoxin
LAAVLAVATLVTGCAAGRAAPARPGSSSAQAVGTTSFPAGHRPVPPEVSGTSLTGALLRLPGGYRGRVVVLNFWASWCVPCRAEGPVLARLWRGYKPGSVQFAGVDVSDARAQAEAFEHRFGIGYPSLYDPSAQAELAFGRLIPPAIPDTLVVDRNGDIAGRIIGQVTYAGLKRLIDQALDGLPLVTAGAGCPARRCTLPRIRGCTAGRPGTCSRTAAAAGRSAR